MVRTLTHRPVSSLGDNSMSADSALLEHHRRQPRAGCDVVRGLSTIGEELDLALSAGGMTDRYGDGQADQPGGEVTKPGEALHDEELADEDDLHNGDEKSRADMSERPDHDHAGSPEPRRVAALHTVNGVAP